MIAKYHVLNKKVIIFSLGPQRAAAVHCILQEGGGKRTVRQETSNFKTGTLPVNMCETAVHGGERLDFAQNEGSEVPQDDEKKDGSSSGI